MPGSFKCELKTEERGREGDGWSSSTMNEQRSRESSSGLGAVIATIVTLGAMAGAVYLASQGYAPF